ncbi:MAG: HAMP domain-containing histidine kinase [Bacteroidia bacterium]|nr:HAMP domain-containing histidine kinase [Bacteroidia bacterium]
MKLLTKTTVYYLMYSLAAFVAGGIILYIFLSSEINEEILDSLMNQKKQLIKIISEKDTLLGTINTAENSIYIEKIQATEKVAEIIGDTLLYNTIENELASYRYLIFSMKSKNANYRVCVFKSMMESEDLISGITMSLWIILIILLVSLITVNYYISKKIWRPFYSSLQKLEQFDLSANKPLELDKTNISEFKKLYEAIKKMTEKSVHDFNMQKEFSENASHELQTPLAIIKSKTELLMQSENLAESQIQLIQSIYDATHRLSKINQALVLITKIENRQFSSEPVNIQAIIEKHLQNYFDLIEQKQIELSVNFNSIPSLNINPDIADILISNLLSNSIKHNFKQGKINISLNSKEFIIENSGPPVKGNPQELFNRFHKGFQDSGSLGLGLAIVKKIAVFYNIEIRYLTQNENHIFKISFPEI